MGDFSFTSIYNYRPAAFKESASEVYALMQSSMVVIKELIRRKRPTSPLRQAEAAKKQFKAAEHRNVTNDDTFLGIHIKRKGEIGVVIGTGLHLANPKLCWVNIQHLGIQTHEQLAKWAKETFYAIKQLLHVLGVSFCALVLQPRRGYTGIDSEIISQCAAIPEVKFMQVDMTASIERILLEVLSSDRFVRTFSRQTAEILAYHDGIMQPASTIFYTLKVDPQQVLILNTNDDPPLEKSLIRFAQYLTETISNTRCRTEGRRVIDISRVPAESQMSILALFNHSPEARTGAGYIIFCGCQTSFAVTPYCPESVGS
jgi:hypothetical protein